MRELSPDQVKYIDDIVARGDRGEPLKYEACLVYALVGDAQCQAEMKGINAFMDDVCHEHYDEDDEPMDPWEHRSEDMRCKTCMWYVDKDGPGVGEPKGRCRRHAPVMNGYPVVFWSDWCGDHKLA